MACMEHRCSCGFAEFNNSATYPGVCPSCGNYLQHIYDEDFETDVEQATNDTVEESDDGE